MLKPSKLFGNIPHRLFCYKSLAMLYISVADLQIFSIHSWTNNFVVIGKCYCFFTVNWWFHIQPVFVSFGFQMTETVPKIMQFIVISTLRESSWTKIWSEANIWLSNNAGVSSSPLQNIDSRSFTRTLYEFSHIVYVLGTLSAPEGLCSNYNQGDRWSLMVFLQRSSPSSLWILQVCNQFHKLGQRKLVEWQEIWTENFSVFCNFLLLCGLDTDYICSYFSWVVIHLHLKYVDIEKSQDEGKSLLWSFPY